MIESLASNHDLRGSLSSLDFSDLCFEPKRIFYVKGVPKFTERGNHAHRRAQQYLICLEGKIQVKLFDGLEEVNYLLKKNQMIFIDKLVWDSQTYMTGKDTLLSICSTEYDPDDYITDIEELKRIKGV